MHTIEKKRKKKEVFLVLDSCGVTERNGNSIGSDITDDTIEND